MPHRHWTHLMSLFPYDMLDEVDSAYRQIAYRSLENFAFQSCGLNGEEAQSFADIAAIIMYALFGDTAPITELADNYLHYRGGRAMNVSTSTMYKEYGPVLESPIFFANAVQECIVMTRKNRVLLFPALPQEWGDVVFHDWLCGGGFHVSGRRAGGRIEWIALRHPAGGEATFTLSAALKEFEHSGDASLVALDPDFQPLTLEMHRDEAYRRHAE